MDDLTGTPGGIAARLAQLTDAARQLNEEEVPRLRREFVDASVWVRKMLTGLSVAVVLLAVVVATLGGIGVILYKQLESDKAKREASRQTIADLGTISKRLDYYTSGEGKRQSDARVAGYLSDLRRSILVAGECGATSDTAAAYRACTASAGVPAR